MSSENATVPAGSDEVTARPDPRQDPAKRRRIALTAAVLAGVAVGFYVAFILFTAAHG